MAKDPLKSEIPLGSLPGHAGVPVGEYEEEFFNVLPTFDQDGVQATAGIGEDGKEYGDPVPMAPPIGYKEPPDLMSMIRSMVQSEQLQRAADEQGFDTFEEAGDFDIEDDPVDPKTPHEALFDPPPAPPPAAPGEGAPPSPPPAPVAVEGGGGGATPQPPPPVPPAPPAKPPGTST